MNILVIPSVREDSLRAFIKAWDLSSWHHIIVIEDNPEQTFSLDINCDHYSWREIQKDLGKDAWIISKKDSAIRAYGFLKAYQKGADYIFTLDDDTAPTSHNHVEMHVKNMEATSRWTESVPCKRTRGLPYKNRGILPNVMMSVGFWTGVPDLDSINSLIAPESNFQPLEYSRILSSGQYVPICGMNLAFKRELTPACYFPIMGDESPYHRFDDIWFGILVKKICDHLGWHISCGTPFVEHKKHSNPFTNLEKEAPGIAFNEIFWEYIDAINLKGKNPRSCMKEIAKKLSKLDNIYMAHLGEAISVWEGLF